MKKHYRAPTTVITVVICILISLAAIFLPKYVNQRFMFGTYPSASGLGNEEWLGFWGSYLGGLLGSVAALIALVITICQQDKHHADSEEAARLSLLPIVVCSFLPTEPYIDQVFSTLTIDKSGAIHGYTAAKHEGVDEFLKKHSNDSCALFSVKNIGVGPSLATEVYIDNTLSENAAHIGGLSAGESKTFVIAMPKNHSCTFFLHFVDVFNNDYTASSKAIYQKEKGLYSFSVTTTPTLSISKKKRKRK